MSLFGKSYLNESAIEDSGIKGILESVIAEEPSSEDLSVACIENAISTQKNFNILMEAVGCSELEYLSKKGSEMVYNEETSKGFIDKAIEIFKSALAKVTGIYEKVVAWFDANFKDIEGVFEKYADKLKGKTATLQKGYIYSLAAASKVDFLAVDARFKPAVAGQVKISNFFTRKLMDISDEDMDNGTRAAMLGALGSMNQSEFNAKLKAMLRNGATEPTNVTLTVEKVKAEMNNLKTAKEASKKALDAARKAIAEKIKALEASKKTFDKANNGQEVQAANKAIKLFKGAVNCGNIANGIIISAAKEAHGQVRKALSAMLTTSVKEAFEAEEAEGFVNEGAESVINWGAISFE